MLPTAIFVTLLGNVYSHLMGYQIGEYMPYLATGYVVWRFMLQVINDSSGTLHSHKAYIMDGRVRLTDFLLRSFAKAGLQFLFGMIVVVAVVLWFQSWQGLLSLATMLLTMPLLLANLFWISVCVGLIGARFPDTRDAIGTVLVAGFLLTPILWMIDRFPPDSLRGFLARLNPAYHLIDLVRSPVLGHLPEKSSVIVALVMCVVGWCLASWLYRRYARFVALWV
ncbi:ABC transporter permease [Luteimonas lutimaris]|uniref:ABC transporter permease n=1 Tax=Luteimonas lutimaris TaxID=698645 RepID=A0ABP7MWR2_9GAMM